MIRVLVDGNIAVIHVEKNIISENVGLLEEKIKEAKEKDARIYIFDFHNVEYMCSSALGIIAQTLRVSSEVDGKVYFCSLSQKLEMLFDATKFLNIVEVAPSVEEALEKSKSIS